MSHRNDIKLNKIWKKLISIKNVNIVKVKKYVIKWNITMKNTGSLLTWN